MSILSAVFIVSFWSAVLAFIPVTFYLLVKNPPIYRAEQIRERGIFILGDEGELQKNKKSRLTVILIIYGVSLAFLSGVYVMNCKQETAGVNPFDILSTLSVLIFGGSVLTYLPMAIYLALKNPWRYKEEGVCLTWIYKVYGAGVLIFSIFFIFHWLRSNQLLVPAGEILSSVVIVLFGAAVLSYLPILGYVCLQIIRGYSGRVIHSSTIFVIYSVCFFIFSAVYLINWTADRREGGEERSSLRDSRYHESGESPS